MRIAFCSTMGGMPWGGSEELWSRAAMALLRGGHQVAFNSVRWGTVPPPLARLIEAGAAARFRRREPFGRRVRRALEGMHLLRLKFATWLRATQPGLVVISLSCLSDDPRIADTCRALGIPYVVLLQAANSHFVSTARWIEEHSSAYAHAERCYFVSAENRETVEVNLAIELPRSEIVDNPFNVPPDAAPAWPATDPTWKLACVARLHTSSKGQDILLRALRQPKWRDRPLEVVLWGHNQGALPVVERLIELYGLQRQVRYGGFATDMVSLWSEYHGLLLPSRYEGNALAMVEAMLCGRVPIVTNVGRAAELIDDNESGFIAPAATVELVDDALERAWQRRHDWQAIGQRAAQVIRERHSVRPAEDFADRLLEAAAAAKRPHRRAA